MELSSSLTEPASDAPVARSLSTSPATLDEGLVPAPLPNGQAQADHRRQPPLTVIERRSGWRFTELVELWRYRELLFFLTWRDVKIRYKQTVLGFAWAILQPLATMIVFSIFFGRLADMKSADVDYSLFVLAGILPWTFFASAISLASQSIVTSRNLVTKVYFPRLIIPMGAVGACLVDFVVSFGLLLVMMPFYQNVHIGWNFLLLPVLSALLVTAAVGVGSILAALTVAYRDFRYIVPFAVQLWMFATPSIYLYADAVASSRWRAMLPLNPVYGLITNFRIAALGGELRIYDLAVSGTMSLLLLASGWLYFRRVERNFADII